MRIFHKATILALVLLVSAGRFVFAGDLPTASPESVGLSTERLARVGAAIEAEINAGAIAGGVLLVARHGKVAYLEAYGMQNKSAGVPMHTDSLFRLFSMTKPIVSPRQRFNFVISTSISSRVKTLRVAH